MGRFIGRVKQYQLSRLRVAAAAVLSILAFAAAGCGSSQPLDPLERISVRESLARLKLPLPVSIGVLVKTAPEPEKDLGTGWGFAPDESRARADIVELLARAAMFESVKAARAKSSSPARNAVPGHDMLLEIALSREDVRYVERNHLWWPSLALWLIMWFPSWLVPDETYSMELSATVSLTGTGIHTPMNACFNVVVHCALNDVERGFHLLGIFRVPMCLSRSDYRSVRRCLEKRARAELHARLLEWLASRMLDK